MSSILKTKQVKWVDKRRNSVLGRWSGTDKDAELGAPGLFGDAVGKVAGLRGGAACSSAGSPHCGTPGELGVATENLEQGHGVIPPLDPLLPPPSSLSCTRSSCPHQICVLCPISLGELLFLCCLSRRELTILIQVDKRLTNNLSLEQNKRKIKINRIVSFQVLRNFRKGVFRKGAPLINPSQTNPLKVHMGRPPTCFPQGTSRPRACSDSV